MAQNTTLQAEAREASGKGVARKIRVAGYETEIQIDQAIAYMEERRKRDEPFALFPDFPQGGEMDASEYADGSGKVEIRANVEAAGEKRVVIREIPYGTGHVDFQQVFKTASDMGVGLFVGEFWYVGNDDCQCVAAQMRLDHPKPK